MSTRTNTIISKTSNNPRSRGRGRGNGRGRGRGSNRNFTRDNIQYNENMKLTASFHTQGSESSSSGPKGYANSRGNNSKSDNSNRSLSPSKISNTIPSHAQNPFFVGELMSRFNNMVPTPSFIIDDEADAQQSKVLLHSDEVSKINSLGTLRNTSAPINRNLFCDSVQSSDFHDQNKNHGKININQNRSQEGGRNRTQGKSNVKRLHPQKSQLVSQHEVASFFSNGEEGSGRDIRKAHCNDWSLFKPDFVTNNPSVTSNNSMNPTSLDKVSLERNKEITQPLSQGLNRNHCESKDLKQPLQNHPYGLIAERTTPRIKHNLQNSPSAVGEENKFHSSNPKYKSQHSQVSSVLGCKESSNTINSNPKSNKVPMYVNSPPQNKHIPNGRYQETRSQHFAVSDNFFSRLNAIEAITDSADRVSVKKEVRRDPKENRISQTNGSSFNPFLKTKNHTSAQHYQQSTNGNGELDQEMLAYQRRYNHETNNSNSVLPEDSGAQRFKNQDVAGRNHFSVQRPLRDVNERVLSRMEALERTQQQYVIQRSEAEAKKREKEEKKRQEFLAKYSHVDQGYRLGDGLLDEAAGYAPGYIQYETVEDIRQRQQERLNRDALVFLERQREDQEKQRRLEEKKARAKLDKNKHISAGYRLGDGANSVANFLPEEETEEEALQRQEEQLVLEMIMQNEMELHTKRNEEQGLKERGRKQVPNSSKTESMNMNPPLRATPSPTKPSSSRYGQKEAPLRDVSNNMNNTEAVCIKNEVPVIKMPNPQVEQDIKASRKSEVFGPPEASAKKPASCMLRNKNGAVLVLRPTAEDLNRALITRLEVQDEVDKLGYSRLYIPTREQAPLYSNNRFERKLGSVAEGNTSVAAIGIATGAIPKNTSKSVQAERKNRTTLDDSMLAAVPNKTTLDKTATLEEPTIDYKAELKAARLRFQQKYDENLKKNQAQHADS